MMLCKQCHKGKPEEDFLGPNPKKQYKCCLGCRARAAAYRASGAARSAHLMRQYGITEQEYTALLRKQKGRCALCGDKPPRHRQLDVDHNHLTGKVRGLLCIPCNLAVGVVEERWQEDFSRVSRYLS